jgi:hypothetical protein
MIKTLTVLVAVTLGVLASESPYLGTIWLRPLEGSNDKETICTRLLR